jgi:RimJ/RimL family protein N-acetyltransferase
VDTYRLRNDTHVRIRPIRPDDGQRLQSAYASLSTESKYCRFLAAKPHLTNADTEYLVNVDGADHVALVAIAADDPDTILGVARFVRQQDDPELGELAIVVCDELQRQGLGSELLRKLGRRAHAVGVHRIRGTMLAENRAAHRLVRRAAGPGGAIRERPRGYLHEIEIELPRTDSDELELAA